MIKWASVIALLIVVIVGSIKIFNQYGPIGRNNLLKRAIPKDAAFFVEVRNLKNLKDELNKKPYSSYLVEFPLVKKINDYCSVLEQLYEKNSDWKKAIFQNTLVASYHFIGNNSFDLVMLLDFRNFSESTFYDQLQKLKIASATRNFKGEKIYEISFQNGIKLNLSFLNNVCVISETASLTEDAVAQMLGRNSLMEDKSFADLMQKVPDEFEMSLYINYHNLSEFMGGYSIQESQDYLKAFSSFSDWSVFDLKFEEKEIKVHGFSMTNNKSNWLQQFDGTTFLSNEFCDNIPDIAAIVMSTSLGTNSVFDKINSSLQTNSDYRRYIKTWIGNELDFVLTEPVNNNFSPQSFLVFNGINSARATESLRQFATIKAGGDSAVFSKYKSISVFQLRVGDAFKTYFPNSLISVKDPFCCIYNNSVIMANTLGQLKMYIDKLNDKNVLTETVFDKSSFKNSQYTFWFNPSRLKDFIGSLSSDEFKQNFKIYFELLKKSNSVILPFTLKENYYETNGSVSFSDAKTANEVYAWKTQLDTIAILAPQIMHDAEGNKIILIQDAFFQLYCINKGGEVVWKRKMDSPIMGEVFQLDLYSNGEQQYVLNTNGGIYLFDINGKDINNFPIRLAAPATSALNMIDFDGRQQYKYFVSCSNGCIYGFEKSGRPLGGWNPNAGNGIINNQLQFFKTVKNEFLTVVDANGKLLLFDRNGRRSSKEYKTTLSMSNPLMIGKQNQLVAIDNTGKVYELSLDGKAKLYNLIADESQYAVMNIGRDTSIEVNLLLGQKLIKMGIDTAQVFTYNFETANPTQLKLFSWDSDNYNMVLASDEANQLLFLINSEGKLLNGFPKKGNSFSALTDFFGNNEAMFLTVQYGNELIAYPVYIP